METINRPRLKLIVTLASSILLLAVGAAITGAIIARNATPQATLVTPLPETVSLGARQSVAVDLCLPWGRCPYDAGPTISSPFVIAGHHARRSGLGWGTITWRMDYHVAALELSQRSEVALRYQTLPSTIELVLGQVTVAEETVEGTDSQPVLASLPKRETIKRPWWIVPTVAIALVVAILARRLSRRKSTEDALPTTDFMAELERLKTHNHLSREELDEHVFRLVRTYLSAKWDLPMETVTARECLHRLEGVAPGAVTVALQDYLSLADRLKFSPDTDGSLSEAHIAAAHHLYTISEQAVEYDIHD